MGNSTSIGNSMMGAMALGSVGEQGELVTLNKMSLASLQICILVERNQATNPRPALWPNHMVAQATTGHSRSSSGSRGDRKLGKKCLVRHDAFSFTPLRLEMKLAITDNGVG